MRLTIGRKLGIGFGAVIALTLAGAALAYIYTGQMIASQTEAFDEAVPISETCHTLETALQESIATLRGYVILNDDPELAETLRTQHRDAWDRIEATITRLKGFNTTWSADDARSLSTLERAFDEYRGIKAQLISTADHEDNFPAQRMVEREVSPQFVQAFNAVTNAIDLEAELEPTSERRALLVAMATFRGMLASHMSDLRAFVLSGSATYEQRAQESWQNLERAQASVQSLVHLFTAEQRANWDRLVPSVTQYFQSAQQAIKLRQAPDWNRASYMLSTDVLPIVTMIQQQLGNMTQSASTRVRDARARVASDAQALRMTLFTATLLAIILSTVIAITLSRAIVVAVSKVVARARQIAAGDLTGEPLDVRGNDEFTMLARTFNEMQAGLKDVTAQIRQVTENVNAASAEILAAAQQQASSTREQAATLQQITSTMQEICQSGEQVSQRAKDIVTSVESTITSNASGVEAVQASTRNMDTIREQVEEVAENIVALSERTQTIGEIISAVTDIAEQSNLLALNAAIEAVSAGEQGSRFSVVATEMKNLADQAKDSTVQVRSILGEIQKGINSSVMMTEEAVKRVETGKRQAGDTERTIRDMTGTTQTSVQTFEQIIGASAQQQIGFDQVAQGVKDIHIAVEQTAAGVTQLERSTTSLNALSQQLRTAVERYRV